jgi:AraC-like DNA-binding protein
MAGSIRNMTSNGQDRRPGEPDGSALDGLIAPGLVRIEHHPAPPELQPFVTTLFTLRCDEPRISDVLPAAVGYLAVLLSGTGTVRFVSGRCDLAYPETLLTPTSAAATLEIKGPWRMAVAALSPLGWAGLTGLDAGEHADRALNAAEVLGVDAAVLGECLRALHAAAPDNGAALVEELARFIEPRLRPINPRHAVVVGKVAEWISASFNPDLIDLQQATGYSARQLQRLVERYYGSSPKQLARKYRALRVAALLQSDETSEARAAELLNLFYDQSHLTREMRHFLGRTPARLAKGEDSLLSEATALRNYREFRPNVARIPGD